MEEAGKELMCCHVLTEVSGSLGFFATIVLVGQPWTWHKLSEAYQRIKFIMLSLLVLENLQFLSGNLERLWKSLVSERALVQVEDCALVQIQSTKERTVWAQSLFCWCVCGYQGCLYIYQLISVVYFFLFFHCRGTKNRENLWGETDFESIPVEVCEFLCTNFLCCLF